MMRKKSEEEMDSVYDPRDNADPSSFVEEGAPDSFADIDAKLKALEEKTKQELAKLQSDTASPSSFVEMGTAAPGEYPSKFFKKIEEQKELMDTEMARRDNAVKAKNKETIA